MRELSRPQAGGRPVLPPLAPAARPTTTQPMDVTSRTRSRRRPRQRPMTCDAASDGRDARGPAGRLPARGAVPDPGLADRRPLSRK